jgi:probable F420-dependent oxidoreductase
MQIGLMATAWEDPRDCVGLARLAEDRGIESIWFGEHSHLPASEGHAFVDQMPEFYKRIPDPYVVLSAVAVATKTIRLGTAVALPGQGDALSIAKTIASLDQLSGGRFEWGIGYGWNKTEMRDHGLNPRHRMSRLAEVVAAVRKLWHDDVCSFDGAHVQFGDCWSYPKPLQNPHPPILLGCRAGPRAFGHLVDLCDGWLPSVEQSIDGAGASLQALRARFADAGRDPASLRVTFIDSRGLWVDVDVETYRARRRLSIDMVKCIRDLGADRVVVGMPLFRPDMMEPMLDAVAELIPAAAH